MIAIISHIVKKTDVPEELPVEPVLPPGPEPGSKEWEYVDQPIDMVNMFFYSHVVGN